MRKAVQSNCFTALECYIQKGITIIRFNNQVDMESVRMKRAAGRGSRAGTKRKLKSIQSVSLKDEKLLSLGSIQDSNATQSLNDIFSSETFHDWWDYIKEERQKDYWKKCSSLVVRDMMRLTIYPLRRQIFYAFTATRFHDLKVVILGQDPYHGIGQAMGLAFSIPRQCKPIPPSLVNIYREIVGDPTGKPSHGDLNEWAVQGVLLLNTVLTVSEGKPLSHKNYGWEIFTDTVLKIINDKKEHVVFLLWGKSAQRKAHFLNSQKHYILTAGHPSPLSVQHFRGCNHFNLANAYLSNAGLTPIDWTRPWNKQT